MAAIAHQVPDIRSILDKQRTAFSLEGYVSREVRIARLQSVIDLLVKYKAPLCAAMESDFEGRHQGFSMVNDILGSLSVLKHARDKVGEWMQSEDRAPFPPYGQLGAKAWVMYQPKGCVGIIGTWNAPVFTVLGPLASVLAAGNRAILKPSEIAPNTAATLARAFSDDIDPLEIAVITGGGDVAQQFTAQPFDHIVFTGSASVAKSVMRNAAENLVPLTLELGGKSPTIISRSANLQTVAYSIAVGKSANSGQFCCSPDVVYVPREWREEFILALRKSYEKLLPRTTGNLDMTSVINARHLERVEVCISDAARTGARIETVGEKPNDLKDRRRPLTLVVDPPVDSKIMREEIFGPALVMLTYDTVENVIADINSRPRPLSLYYFGEDQVEEQKVLRMTISGGVTINAVMFHPGMLDAPFGGIGNSGMGHYNGREGFIEFSHTRTIFKAGPHDLRREWGLLPPYSEQFFAVMDSQATA